MESDMETYNERVKKSGLYTANYRKALAFSKLALNAPVSTVNLTTNAITHAMTSFSPKARYAVGMDSKAIRLAQNFLPATLRDAVMKVFL
jgi:hypothetical protein